jgi:hypothetical protein
MDVGGCAPGFVDAAGKKEGFLPIYSHLAFLGNI